MEVAVFARKVTRDLRSGKETSELIKWETEVEIPFLENQVENLINQGILAAEEEFGKGFKPPVLVLIINKDPITENSQDPSNEIEPIKA